MLRQIITIDEDKCTGCGLCVTACHEGAIALIDGKAKLIRDDYCDGMGDCLPACPTGAITFEMREAAVYDEEAVKKNMEAAKIAAEVKEMLEAPKKAGACSSGGCPSAMARPIKREAQAVGATAGAGVGAEAAGGPAAVSQLVNWPVQIKLAPPRAPYFDGAKLLIAADCTAYAYASFHQDFMRGKVTLIGCPKLDAVDYSEKLTAIISENDIKSVGIVRMEVPCCGGIEMAAKRALQASGKFIPWQVVTISVDGRIVD